MQNLLQLGIDNTALNLKIFCKVLLGRIDRAIDNWPWEEKAGFRRGRGCVNQLIPFATSLSIVWDGTVTPLHFIDFRKLLTVCTERAYGGYWDIIKFHFRSSHLFLRPLQNVILGQYTLTGIICHVWSREKVYSLLDLLAIIDWITKITTLGRSRGMPISRTLTVRWWPGCTFN